MFLILFIAFIVTALATAFLRITKDFGYFKKRGVPEVPTIFPWGSELHKKMLSGKVSFITSSFELYNKVMDIG